MSAKIITENVCPPVPDRRFDWRARFDGDERGLTGWGTTEQEAKNDLLSLDIDSAEEGRKP